MAEVGAAKTVLLVTDRDLRRGSKGNVQRIVSLLASIRGAGCRVLLMTPRATAGAELSACYDELLFADAPVFAGGQVADYDSSAFEHAVRQVCADRSVDMVVAEYAWIAPCLEHASRGCLRVVDAHDVLHERSASFADRGLDPWVACSAETERRLLSNADVVLAMQDEEAAAFESLLGDSTRVMTIPHPARNGGRGYAPSGGAVVMFVGSWHDGNLGIRDFVDRSWATIRAKLPQAELRVYGEICGRLEPGPGCRLLGVVDDLSMAYHDAALVICPITAGGGLKIKVIEALDHGRAVVATPLAVRGMPPARAESWRVADGWPAFAEAVVGLLADDDRRHRLELDGLTYVRCAYSEERAQAALLELLAPKAEKA